MTDLPAYTVTDDDGLFERIEHAPGIELPIMRELATFPRYSPDRPDDEWRRAMIEAVKLQHSVVRSFFSAVKAGHYELVGQFVERGLVSPETTTRNGETPLLAAVRVGKLPMVSKLVFLGATVDGYGTVKEKSGDAERTPLQSAASLGHLALVKALMEDYGADDALMAPDGALALRLAAMNGHREVVDYLPLRRGGAWLRWKSAHQREMKVIRRALRKIAWFITVLVWEVPKVLLYEAPRETAKYYWQRRHKFAGWCKRQMVELPTNIRRGAQKLGRGIKKMPHAIRHLAKGFVNLVKAIPGALKIVGLWIWRGLQSIGTAVFNVAMRIVSFVHTVLSALVSFFRDITLKDIQDGLSYIIRGIFIETPKALWSFIAGFGQMSYHVLKATLGLLGKIIWWLCYAVFWLIKYIPQKLWQCLAAMGRSIERGYQEVRAYFDPKRV